MSISAPAPGPGPAGPPAPGPGPAGPPAPGPGPGGPPAPHNMGPGIEDSRNLHDLAVDVHTDMQKLATGLAHAGASPMAVAQLTKMGEVIAQIVKVLGMGPVGSDNQPGPGHPMPGHPAPAPPAPAPAAPQHAAPPAGPDHAGTAHASIHAATKNLQAAMIASKAAREQQGQ